MCVLMKLISAFLACQSIPRFPGHGDGGRRACVQSTTFFSVNISDNIIQQFIVSRRHFF